MSVDSTPAHVGKRSEMCKKKKDEIYWNKSLPKHPNQEKKNMASTIMSIFVFLERRKAEKFVIIVCVPASAKPPEPKQRVMGT
jgi:hypothetical protein